MSQLRRLLVIITILTCFLQAQGADKYTDENRPYEFGFTIDGEQHRHEKKDERGLIMGEFGFITADGVYHVTVYATDENGNFKILSMKNIRVKPYPTAPERKGHSLPFPPSQQAPVAQAPSPQQNPPSIASPVKSCSHCSIPTTKAPVQNYPEQNYPNQPSAQNYPQSGVDFPGNYPQQGGIQQNYPQEGGVQQNYPQEGGVQQNYPQDGGFQQNYPQQSEGGPDNYPQGQGSPQNYPQGGQGSPQNYPQGGQGSQQNYPQQGADSPQYSGQNLQPGERNPKQFNYPPESGGPTKPTLISAQMQIVDKNTDIYQRRPGEKEGLPDGVTKQHMKLLLYTFNYTVGFHGHHEEGYTDGTKQGYYFITGRNGVRTRVDYVADETGFHPKISQEVLDLLSEDVPKPETEKDEKYGLKGYEFKWLYYPVDSKRR